MKYAGMVVAVLLVLVMTGVDAIAQSRVRGFPSYGVVSVTRPGVTPRDNRVYGQLEETLISFTFNDQPLQEAIDFLATLGGVNIVLDRSKAEEGQTVTLKLNDVSLLTALKLVTEQVDLKWVIRDGVVFISDEEGAKQEEVTVVYDVSDLLAQPPDFKGPAIELQSLSRSSNNNSGSIDSIINTGDDDDDEETEKTRQEMLEELVELIKQVIEPGTWEDYTP